jgi:hypothetical protein
MKNVKAILAVALLLTTHIALGQPQQGKPGDIGDDPYEHKSYFMCGVNYLSDNVYLGRRDTAMISYLSPYLGYHDKSGIYTSAMASYGPFSKQSHVDLLTLEAGYDHSFGDHFNGGFNVDKFFYNKQTVSIRGNTKAGVGIFGQYTNDWIEPQANFDLNFGKKTDYVFGLALDHDFNIGKTGLELIPTVMANAATSHFYDEYLVTRQLKKNKNLKITKAIANAAKFKLMDVEFSTKINYRVSKWLFTCIPTYVLPLNPAAITLPQQTITEQLYNSFCLEVDIRHR